MQSWLPDLILLDLQMPPPNGLEVYRKLKEDERTKDIPIVFMTAKSEDQIKLSGIIKDSVTFYRQHLKKPFTKDELVNKVESVLSGIV